MNALKVLILDDERKIADKVAAYLEKHGYSAYTAYFPSQAFKILNSEKIDILISDIMLPEMDGWEATRRLKADPDLNATPILALSASVMSGDPDKALEAGCDDFEFKPVDFPRLLSKIEKLLES